MRDGEATEATQAARGRRRVLAVPSKTPRQARAMRAAAAGHSRIGIPRSVAREYVAADTRRAQRRKRHRR